jgi:acetyl-CoA/propionyl-CoA carboxylase biotin carboxyl carrier protein
LGSLGARVRRRVRRVARGRPQAPTALRPFRKILVANRGEIAVRIIRAARELGCGTVAVYSESDREALHVALADEAYLLGPAAPRASYLNAERILAAARASAADAVHPGYGFFAENAEFARSVLAAGIAWIGPHPEAIALMGDKLRARAAMVAAGVPVVPGALEPLADLAAARAAARELGYPLALKASAGGGGKGLRIAHAEAELESAFRTAAREAEAYFGNPAVYAERYLDNPKHVELQVLCDKHGAAVHVGERDCSLQRRHQKLFEETPALVARSVRERIRATGLAAARAIGYDSAGTIEYLVAGTECFFLEMNTRIQVEHTVSEMTSGIDLVQAQIRVAAGLPLGIEQAQVAFRGHAIEVRVNAEDPAQGFRAAPGVLRAYREPGGFGVRVDGAAFAGLRIPPDYDSLIAKLIVWGEDRAGALARLARALDEFVVEGVPTTRAFLRALAGEPPVADGSYGTATLERFAATLAPADDAPRAPLVTPPAAPPAPEIRVEVNDRLFRVRLLDALPGAGGRLPAARRPPPRRREAGAGGNAILAPIHGVCVEVLAKPGDAVAAGSVVAVLEAMKMMNEIRAHRAGVVAAVGVAPGDTVEARSVLVTLHPA